MPEKGTPIETASALRENPVPRAHVKNSIRPDLRAAGNCIKDHPKASQGSLACEM